MTLAERIHQRKRILKKRKEIVKSWDKNHPLLEEIGKMTKFNGNCGCKMCKYYKHVGNSKEKLSHRDKKLKDQYEN